MVGDKVKYTCKNCGWTTSIREEWSDLKPKRCMNKKCNTSFLKYPDNLIIQTPEKPAEISKPLSRKKQSNARNANSESDDQP